MEENIKILNMWNEKVKTLGKLKLKEAQELLAKTYNVKKAYFVVNGSTAGNLASIFDAFNEGDEVLVERNCHKSVYNGLILRKLKVKYIEPVIH